MSEYIEPKFSLLRWIGCILDVSVPRLSFFNHKIIIYYSTDGRWNWNFVRTRDNKALKYIKDLLPTSSIRAEMETETSGKSLKN